LKWLHREFAPHELDLSDVPGHCRRAVETARAIVEHPMPAQDPGGKWAEMIARPLREALQFIERTQEVWRLKFQTDRGAFIVRLAIPIERRRNDLCLALESAGEFGLAEGLGNYRASWQCVLDKAFEAHQLQLHPPAPATKRKPVEPPKREAWSVEVEKPKPAERKRVATWEVEVEQLEPKPKAPAGDAGFLVGGDELSEVAVAEGGQEDGAEA